MNLYFVIGAGLLIGIAWLFLLPPLWRQRPVDIDNPNQRNVAIARQRLAELDEQLASGALSQADYDAQRAELELALSDDLDVALPPKTHASGRWLAYVLLVMLPLLATGLYALLGNFQAIEPTAAMLATEPAPADIAKMVAKLAERLKDRPDDAQGWVMLGKSYKYLQQYQQAADAFAEAYRLLGDQPEIMLLYADALGIVHDGQLAGQPAELIDAVLAKEPDHIGALWLGGMAQAQAGDTEAARRLWQKLAALLPPGSEDQQQIQEVLAKLDATPAPQAVDTAATLSVNVQLAADWQKTARPDDTVFIYAQTLSGPKMPLAILRKRVADLPITVSLTDAMAMTPAMKLSHYSQVRLSARISKSGNAAPQPGDLIGMLEPVAVADRSVKTLIIDRQIP